MELLSKIDQLQIKHKGLRNENAIKLINQFKKEVCKKQRNLCGEIYNDSTNRWEFEVMERIENTDEPK